MKVTILEPSGFCTGVERAIQLAIKTKSENNGKDVVILGMLVHNQDTLEMLNKHGINTIYDKNSSLEELINLISKPSIVILTAHGHDKKIESLLANKGHQIVDATCPFVKNSFNEITNGLKTSKDILYIGVKNHPESNAALSLSDVISLVDINKNEIPEIKSTNPFVISQTTLSEDETKDIIEKIKNKYPEAIIAKGICNASTQRQNALKNLPNDIDGIIVVGGENSNNSKTLYKLAKNLYPNKYVTILQNASQIKEKDLKGLNHIVISSGASTPKEVIGKIKDKLLN